jgi:hypothetical protein
MMKAHLVQCAGAIAALAIVSACASGSSVAPSTGGTGVQYIGTSAIPVAGAHPRLRAMPGYPAIVPAVKANLYEYIFNEYDTYASIFDYPKSTAQIGQIKGAGGQGCTNALYGYGKKIIWNVGGPMQIDEYQVPKKLLKTLTVNYSFASSCAMNASGDLAVGILYGGSYGGGGEVVIFKNASGSGTAYKTALDEEFFDGYDNRGNLFADGFTGDRSGFALVELAKGSNKFVTVKTSNSPVFPGSVQWDGTYVTVFDQIESAVYQYTVSGTTATLKKTVQLTGSGDCAQTWIVKGLLFCGDAGNNNGSVFKYPAGGSPIATLTGNFDVPLGVTAAKK